MIEAEANRIATSNAATPRAGIRIPEAKRAFYPETANQKPFSWGSKGDILFCEREYPLCPCRPQAAYPSAPCVERSLRPVGEKRAVRKDSSFSFCCVGRIQRLDIFLIAIQKVCDLRRAREYPRERIEHIERADRMEVGEHGVDPRHAEHARAEEHEDHRHEALSKAARGGGGAVHRG